MNIKLFNENIGILVGQDKLKEAIELLKNLLHDCPNLDDVILQSSRLTDLMRQIRNGTIGLEDANVTKNKIRLAILSLSEEIEESVSNNEGLRSEFAIQRGNEVNWNITQNHSGTGDIIGRDRNTNISVKATIGIIVTGLFSMLFWMYFNTGSVEILHHEPISTGVEEPIEPIQDTIVKEDLKPTIPNANPIPLSETDLPTYNFTIKNFNHRTLHFGLVEVEVIDYLSPNSSFHRTPWQIQPLETLINLKPEIGYKYKSWLAKGIGADLVVASNEAFSAHLKFYQGKFEGGFLSCTGAYALKITFFDSEEKFSIRNDDLIYLVHSEFVSKSEFHRTKKLWDKIRNEN